jgi:trafficking protein particle complex subunit 2
VRTPLQFSLLLSSTLDVFELRARHNAAGGVGLSGDFGLLHAVDERLAAYGFETNTGTKFVVIVDMRGRRIDGTVAGLVDNSSSSNNNSKEKRIGAAAVGLREGEMKPVSSTYLSN